MKRFIIMLILCLMILSTVGYNVLANYPEKPITMIVMYAPGGGTDIFARGLQPGLEEALGVDLVIKNIEGGGGAVGFTEAFLAPSDGYTVTIPNNALFTIEGMGHVDFGYKDFDMLARVVEESYVLCVNKDLPYDNLNDFIQDAKDNPGKLSVGFAGIGSSTHIVSLLLERRLNIDLKQVPYDGGALSLAACMGGHIDAIVQGEPEVISAVEAGEIKPLVVTASKRLETMPDAPTLTELGLGFPLSQWRGIAAPKGVSDEVKEVWENAVSEAVKHPQFIEVAKHAGYLVSPAFGEELNEWVKDMAEVFIPTAKEVSQQ